MKTLTFIFLILFSVFILTKQQNPALLNTIKPCVQMDKTWISRISCSLISLETDFLASLIFYRRVDGKNVLSSDSKRNALLNGLDLGQTTNGQ